MDTKEAVRMMAGKKATKKHKLKQEVKNSRDRQEWRTVNRKEDVIIDCIDNLTVIKKYASALTELETGKVTCDQFLQKHSSAMLCELFKIGLDPHSSEKVRLDAVKDFLDRAGLSSVKKVAVATVDPNMSKQQLMSAIEGITRHADIEIVEDEETESDDSENKD